MSIDSEHLDRHPIAVPGRIGQGTVQIMIGRMVLFASGYFVAMLLARRLGPAEYGLYGIILSVVLWIEAIGDFGIPEAATKLIPEDENRAALIENTTQTLLLILFLFLFALSWVTAPVLASIFHIPQATQLFRLAIIDIPFTGIYFAYQGILVGRQEFGAIGKGLAVYGLTKLLGILVALLLGLSVFWALIANVLATVGALLSLTVYLSPVTFRPLFIHTRLILRLALPIALLLFGTQVLWNMDLWCLKIIGTEKPDTIGIYIAALNVAKVPTTAFSAVNVVILSALSMALARKNRLEMQGCVRGAGRFLWITVLPSCVLALLTGEELMGLLFSQSYSAGGRLLALQIFAFAFFVVAQAFNEMLIARGNAYLAAGITLVHIPLALVFYWMLIPSFGAIGAALALVLTAFCSAIVSGVLVYVRLGALIESSTFFRGAFATALMALVCLQISWTGPWLLLKYAFLLILYALTLLVMGELKWDDLKLLGWPAEEKEKVGVFAK
jgi:O-antigen/teichoic acid export membrane protein